MASYRPSPYVPKGQLSAEDAWRQASPFTGTNSVFFGSNGGGNGWASPPQSLYGGGWSTQGHRSKGQDPKHIPSVPELGGTNFAFNAADGYHYGWARKAPANPAGRRNKDAGVKKVHVAHPKLGWNF